MTSEGTPSTSLTIKERSESLEVPCGSTASDQDFIKYEAVDGSENFGQSSQEEPSRASVAKKRTKSREKEAYSSDESVEGRTAESCPEHAMSSEAKQRRSMHRKQESGGPLRKRSRILRVIEDEDEDSEHREVSCPRRASVMKEISVLPAEEIGTREKGGRRVRRRKDDHKGGDKENKTRRRNSTASKRASTGPIPDNDYHTPRAPTPPAPELTGLRAEMRGMLIESMATSRASSLPVSSLCRSILQSRPSLASQRSERQWLKEFEDVLEEGWRGCGVFGKVESSGKVSHWFVECFPGADRGAVLGPGQDDSGYALEAQWFYIPERDEDQERAALIRSMMPRPAKRSETKKYKQYYYRPLEKMSRWDPEDEI